MIEDFWDNDTLRDLAIRFGHPEPSDGECNNLRQQIADTILTGRKENLNNYSISCDGRSVHINRSNTESLATAMMQTHPNYVPEATEDALAKSYRETIVGLQAAAWELHVGVIGLSRQSGEIGKILQRNPKIVERRLNQIRTVHTLLDDIVMEYEAFLSKREPYAK